MKQAGPRICRPPCSAKPHTTLRIELRWVSPRARSLKVEFYRVIRNDLAIEAPKGYYAALDSTSFNSLIVLDDLTEKGVEFCAHTTEMTRERVEGQLRLLANLHARYYGRVDDLAATRDLSDWSTWFGGTLDFGMEEGSNQGFLDGEHLIPPRLFRRYKEIWPKTLASVELNNASPRALAHGDVHLRNWYITSSGAMGLSDWATLHRGHWARDFAYALTANLTVEDRRSWQGELLRLYLDLLATAGGPEIPYETAFLAYRQQLLTALTFWTITLRPTVNIPDMQPLDATEEFIRRISTAMDDVDSLDSFD